MTVLVVPAAFRTFTDRLEEWPRFCDSLEKNNATAFVWLTDLFAAWLSLLDHVDYRTHAGILSRRAFLFLRPSNESQTKAVSTLQEALADVDNWMGHELGGFSSLFRTAIKEGDVSVDNIVDIEALSEELRDQFMPLEDMRIELNAIVDVTDFIPHVPADACAAVCVASCLMRMLLRAYPDVDHDVFVRLFSDWAVWRKCNNSICRLMEYCGELPPLACLQDEQLRKDGILKPFVLWYIVSLLHRRISLLGSPRHLMDSALADCGLPPFSVFESARLFA